MLIRFAAIALAAAQASPALAQSLSAAPPADSTAPRPATARVVLDTQAGPILLELEQERAPITTANFLRYVDEKRFDGISFYRASRVAPGYGLIQGGLRNDPRRLLPPIAHEPTSVTGLSHVDGAISMARTTPGSAAADFFITIGSIVSMDARPGQSGDSLGFAVFGRVVGGMEVVRSILDMPVSLTEGEGAMKGQMLAAPVRISAARRAD